MEVTMVEKVIVRHDSDQVLHHTLDLLRMFGFEIQPNSTRLGKYVGWMYRFANGLFASISAIMLAVSLWTKPTHLPLYCVLMLIVTMIVTACVTMKNGRKILKSLDGLLNTLSGHQKDGLRKYGRRIVFGYEIGLIILTVFGLVVPFGFKSFEVSKLMVTFEMPDGYTGLVLDSLSFFSSAYPVMSCTTHVILYAMVQKILAQHAKGLRCLTASVTKSEDDQSKLIDLITLRYVQHVNSKQFVNSTLGVVPLMMFIELFMFSTLGLSYVIIYQTGFSLFFVICCIGSYCLVSFIVVYFMVFSATTATDELEKCRSKIIEMIALSKNINCADEKKALYRLVTGLGTVESSAYGLFDVNSTLALSFPNAMIPFLVMILTSYSQLSTDTNAQRKL